MEIASKCPLAVGSFVWQPRPSAHALTILCKATYRLERGVSPLADEQEEVATYDNYWDDDEGASLYAPSDLAPPKRRSDIVLVGAAFAPGGSPVRALTATLEVGEMRKSIEVCCDRTFTLNGQLGEGAPFARMALRWERAAGGPETANPVGVRMGGVPNAEGQIVIPNLQPRKASVVWPGDVFEPAGFGPIAPSWPERAHALGDHLAGWSHARWFERPLPSGVDMGYFNAAPPDQQVAAIAPEARIVLQNLHPRHPRLVTNLARVRPRASVERPGRAPEAIALFADTLWIDTDRAIATLTFRGVAALSRADEPGQVVVSLEGGAPAPKPRMRAATLDGATAAQRPLPFVAPKPAGAPAPKPRMRAATLDGATAAQRPLPFVAPKPGGAEARRRVEAFSTPTPPAPRAPSEEATASLDVEALREEQQARRATLPFVPPAPPPDPARRAAWSEEPTSTVEIDRIRAERQALPFSPAAPLMPHAGAAALLALAAPIPAPAARAAPIPAPAAPAPRRSIARPPEIDARSIETYAAVKAALWCSEGRSRADAEAKIRALGVGEDAYLEAEEKLLSALAEEAGAGCATLARAVRAAIKRAVRAAGEPRQPRASQASGNVPGG